MDTTTAPTMWTAQPEGFTSKVTIRRTVDRNGRARFHYWGLALRWLPISAERATATLAR